MSTQFITLGKDAFEAILDSLGSRWEEKEEGGCQEYVYVVHTSVQHVGVRIYSTVDKKTGKTRDKGADAIRVIHWDIPNNKPIGKGKKILRVSGRTTIEDRIRQRINELVESAKDVKIVDWVYVRQVLETCADHGSRFAEDLLDSLDEFNRLTDRQLSYVLGDESPNSKDTLETQAGRWGMVHTSRHPTKYPKIPEDSPDPIYPEVVAEKPLTTVTLSRPEGSSRIQGVVEIPVDEEAVLPTAAYPRWNYPFDKFNPIQTATVPHIKSDTNIVIGANTSSGKTICAEFLMDQTFLNEMDDRGKIYNRVIYLSPLKSLTQEKYEDWQKRFPKKNITILTGDYTLSEQKKQQLAKSDIIVMTSEMTDSRTRRMHTEKNYWLKEVGLIIVDEAHILSTDRGHAVESGLMRFTRINPNARILLLSATMPNCKQLAEWTSHLNGKDSRVIFSTWRPVKLEMHYLAYESILGYGGRPDYQATQKAKRDLAINLVTGQHTHAVGKDQEKFLVFCHDKGTGRAITKTLNEMGVTTHFHNADLEREQRLEIERRFAQRKGGLRVLVSTSTLAWGRNLPARNVVIVGVHRGIQQVDELDIIQMAGRAGRYGIDPAGTVYLLCPERQEQAWERIFNNPRPVRSGFLTHHANMVGSAINRAILAFHILAEIENRTIESYADVITWFARSLAKYQDDKCFTDEDIKALFDELVKMEMITVRDGYIDPSVTGLGKVSAWLYFSPFDVYAWYCNFKQLFSSGDAIHDMTLCWALADINSYNMGYIPKDLSDLATDWRVRLRSRGIVATDAVTSAIAAWYLLNGKKLEGTLVPLGTTIKYDINRMAQALNLIDSNHAKWDKRSLWETLPARITYGIPEELIELVKVKGIGAKKARKLYDNGVKSLHDLALSNNFQKVCTVAPPTIARRWMSEARDLL